MSDALLGSFCGERIYDDMGSLSFHHGFCPLSVVLTESYSGEVTTGFSFLCWMKCWYVHFGISGFQGMLLMSSGEGVTGAGSSRPSSYLDAWQHSSMGRDMSRCLVSLGREHSEMMFRLWGTLSRCCTWTKLPFRGSAQLLQHGYQPGSKIQTSTGGCTIHSTEPNHYERATPTVHTTPLERCWISYPSHPYLHPTLQVSIHPIT